MHSIGKCFVFFHRHSSDKIYGALLYHLLNFTLHSKANACNIGTFIRFYMQMQVEIKAFAYRLYRPFTQQCYQSDLTLLFMILKKILPIKFTSTTFYGKKM